MEEIDAHDVRYNQGATGAIVRKVDRRLQDYVSVKDFGAVGNGTLDDQDAIQKAVDYALQSKKHLYWPSGRYASSANITNFHQVKHIGPGIIARRSGNYWNITPTGEQINIIYVSNGGIDSNDGFSVQDSTSPQNAFDILSNIGEKSLDGVWRIQIKGSIVGKNAAVNNMPYFKNPIQVWGDDVADFKHSAVPTTHWTRGTANLPHAIRVEKVVDTKSIVFFHAHFRNIKFIGWNDPSQGCAIKVWVPHEVLAENLHAEDCTVGFWWNEGYVRQQYGKISYTATFDDNEINKKLYGIATLYHQTANIGGLRADAEAVEGITFENCMNGVEVGRCAVTYIQGCTFNNSASHHIRASRNSRFSTQSNTFNAFGESAIFIESNSTWTPNNGRLSPEGKPYSDIYTTLSDTKPAYKVASGGVNAIVDRGGQVSLHQVSDGILAINSTERIALSKFNDNTTFIPFRIPGYFFYSSTAKLHMDIFVQVPTNNGGKLELSGNSNDEAHVLASIVIPNDVAARTLAISFSVERFTSAASGANIVVDCPALGIFKRRTASQSLNSSAFRIADEQLLTYRLFWKSNALGPVNIYGMRSYTELL